VIGLVHLDRRVPKCNLLLIVQPILIVRSETRFQNLLLKTQPTVVGVMRIGLSVWPQGIRREVRRTRDHAAPLVHEFFRLIAKHLPASPKYR
jgi:hypothetical protein